MKNIKIFTASAIILSIFLAPLSYAAPSAGSPGLGSALLAVSAGEPLLAFVTHLH